jgi:hypothetical protein
MRYWSMCNNEAAAPFPVVDCKADFATRFDDQGLFTYVLSQDESGVTPPVPPTWIPPDATWLPWGRTTIPNLLIFRNMLAPEGFPEEGTDYYPKAAYCDKQLFISGGWQACFAAAGIN